MLKVALSVQFQSCRTEMAGGLRASKANLENVICTLLKGHKSLDCIPNAMPCFLLSQDAFPSAFV